MKLDVFLDTRFYLPLLLLNCCPNIVLSSSDETTTNVADDPSGQTRAPNCPTSKGQEGAVKTLKAVQILFRHGIRAPTFGYPNDKYSDYDYGVVSFSEKVELTSEGIYHSFLLGRCIRQDFDEFLGVAYSPRKLFCQTSELNRTELTAENVMAGLFPPTKNGENKQPIPCTIIPSVTDNKLKFTAPCPAYNDTYMEYKSTNPESVTFRAKFQWLYAVLTEKSGKPIKDYYDVYQLYDTITIQHDDFNLEYPTWFPILESAMKINNDFSFYSISATRKLQKFVIGPLLNEMVNNFNSMIGENNSDGNRKAKMYLYSGHDTTIARLAQALRIYDRNAPPRNNAALFIELHKLDKKYTIQVFYKDGFDQPVVEKFMPRCPKPCSFQKFKKSLRDVLINDNDWKLLCKNKK